MDKKDERFVKSNKVNTFVWTVFTVLTVVAVVFTDMDAVWILYPLIMWFVTTLLFYVSEGLLNQ